MDCDIYLTGSNAYLLSGELATYLSGRYVETRLLPLSFEEYLVFCGVEFPPESNVGVDRLGNMHLFDDLLDSYLLYGGFPAIADLDMDQDKHRMYLSALYDTVVTRDILFRQRRMTNMERTPSTMLQRLVEYLSDNIGNLSNPNSIANYLTSQGTKTTNKTVETYLTMHENAFLFYEAKRYDVKGKRLLARNSKDYLVDLGLRSYLSGYRSFDTGRVFENAVYLELLRRGYTVYVGKLYDVEIDFIAVRNNEPLYVQVTQSMDSDTTKERELEPLKRIRDNYPKIVVSKQSARTTEEDGILVVGPRNFFLGKIG
jgi:hypothetical protein